MATLLQRHRGRLRIALLTLGCLLCLCAIASAAQLKPYFGLLHSHTSYSDGTGTPDQAFDYAQHTGGLDFLAVTDHNHAAAGGDDGVYLTPQLYQKTQQAAKTHTKNGTFVALCGQEFSTISKGNHVNIFEADALCDVPNGEFNTLYEQWLPAHHPALVQFNHSDPKLRAGAKANEYGVDDYHQSFSDLIELIIGPAFGEATDKPHYNGQHEKDYLFYLNQGFRLGASAGQDNHKANWGTSTAARTGVWAEALTKDKLLEALKARRCYASEDEDLELKVLANGQWMGSEIPSSPGAPVAIKVSVHDPDEPEATYTVQLFYDDAVGGSQEAEIAESKQSVADDHEALFSHTPHPGGYYFVKVIQNSSQDTWRDDAWSSPIWVKSAEDGEEDEISWSEAPDYVGLERIVSGKIVRTYALPNIIFFNFDDDYQHTLSLVIKEEHFVAFGGADEIQERLRDHQVRVKGTISTYGDRVQMLLESPDQILSVEE
jgi:hypothetical protein